MQVVEKTAEKTETTETVDRGAVEKTETLEQTETVDRGAVEQTEAVDRGAVEKTETALRPMACQGCDNPVCDGRFCSDRCRRLVEQTVDYQTVETVVDRGASEKTETVDRGGPGGVDKTGIIIAVGDTYTNTVEPSASEAASASSAASPQSVLPQPILQQQSTWKWQPGVQMWRYK